MTTEPVHSVAADADVFLPADGLSLLGEDQGSGYGGRRFLVGRGDGQVCQLPLLLYLIMAAIAEGGVDGGWSADQVGARVGGRVRAAADRRQRALPDRGQARPARSHRGRRRGPAGRGPGAAPAAPGEPRAGTEIARLPLRRRAAERDRPGAVLAASAGSGGCCAVPQAALGARARRAAVLVSVAAAAPIMAETGTGRRAAPGRHRHCRHGVGVGSGTA